MIGIDIVSIARISRIYEKNKEAFLRRYLRDSEIAQVRTPQNAAGLWAAKEAAAKALGTGIGGELGFHDIIVFKDQKGAPLLDFAPEVKKRFHLTCCSVSISHDGGFAIAAVMLQAG